MDQISVLKLATQGLNDLKVPYFLTGSFAVSYYGKPRATHDIDFKIILPVGEIQKLTRYFSPQFYVSEEGIQEALKHQTMFNLIHHETGTKVDLWILKKDPFDQERWKRRKIIPLFGLQTAITTAEDLILIKLKWFQESESDKHLNDVRGILEIQDDKIDKSYIQQWVTSLGLQKEWNNANQVD